MCPLCKPVLRALQFDLVSQQTGDSYYPCLAGEETGSERVRTWPSSLGWDAHLHDLAPGLELLLPTMLSCLSAIANNRISYDH